MTNRQKVIDALMVVMKSYKEGAEKMLRRSDVYKKYTGSERCIMCDVVDNNCEKCLCNSTFNGEFLGCIYSPYNAHILSIPSKSDAKGRIRELLPAYRKLYALEALKQKSYLFGGVSHG